MSATSDEDARPEFDAETAVAMVLPTTAHARRALRSLDAEGYVVVPKYLLAGLRAFPFGAYSRWQASGTTADADRMEEWSALVRHADELLGTSTPSGGSGAKS